jgi:hypothetical protein
LSVYHGGFRGQCGPSGISVTTVASSIYRQVH